MSISISQPIYIKKNKNYQMKIMLTTIVIIVAVIAAAATEATTVITTIEIFAQNKSSPMDQLINDCMYNNVTACNALEHYNSTIYPATGLNTTAS
jgi:hypothetical protein